MPSLPKRKAATDMVWGSRDRSAIFLHKLRKCLSKAAEPDRKFIMALAQKIANGRGRRALDQA